GFAFGCSGNADAIMPSPDQFTYFQGAGFDCSLVSFLQVDQSGSVNVSRLAARPHVTAGAGGFIDITAGAKAIIFCGFFPPGGFGARIEDGRLQILKEGKNRKFVPEVEHVTFSGRRARQLGQKVISVTDRCVLRLGNEGREGVEIAPGIDLQRDVLEKTNTPLRVAKDLKVMEERLFRPEPLGLKFG